MYYDIMSAQYRSDYKVEVTFQDGKRGVVDFRNYLSKGGVFEKFRDLDFFRGFFVHKELKVLAWPGGIDIAPETIYCEATKSPWPAWAEK